MPPRDASNPLAQATHGKRTPFGADGRINLRGPCLGGGPPVAPGPRYQPGPQGAGDGAWAD